MRIRHKKPVAANTATKAVAKTKAGLIAWELTYLGSRFVVYTSLRDLAKVH